jgi:hypothetical protein
VSTFAMRNAMTFVEHTLFADLCICLMSSVAEARVLFGTGFF